MYELFKFAGKDLKDSLLKLYNRIKKTHLYPRIFQQRNITSLYKKKGEMSDFENQRGIFSVAKIASILDKMIYNDKW